MGGSMMKKLLTLAVSAAMFFSAASSAFAELMIGETNPTVYVDDRMISFQDQKPVIDVSVNRTLVPLRGVFEAMGAGVTWNDENRTITINSKDNITRLILEIGNPVMKVYTAVSLMKFEESTYELETAPVIVNNRTLIPLRAISENMAADVDWDGENHIVNIHSKEYKKFIAKKTEENKGDNENYVYNLKDNLLNLSLSCDKESVEAGEEVVINLDMSNTEVLSDLVIKGVTAAVYYDSSKFTFGKAELIINGEVCAESLGASNGEFMNDSVKTVMVIMPTSDEAVDNVSDSTVVRFTFTSINGEEGEFSLSDRKTHLGYDTGILFGMKSDNSKNDTYEDYTEVYIDTTPIIVK